MTDYRTGRHAITDNNRDYRTLLSSSYYSVIIKRDNLVLTVGTNTVMYLPRAFKECRCNASVPSMFTRGVICKLETFLLTRHVCALLLWHPSFKCCSASSRRRFRAQKAQGCIALPQGTCVTTFRTFQGPFYPHLTCIPQKHSVTAVIHLYIIVTTTRSYIVFTSSNHFMSLWLRSYGRQR